MSRVIFIPRKKSSAAALSSISVFATAISTAETITLPDGIEEGDLIVLFQVAIDADSTPPALVTPSGFSSIDSATITSIISYRTEVAYKLADGTEGGTSITGMSGNNSDHKRVVVFRGDVAATTAIVADVESVVDSGNPPAQTVTSGSGTAPLIVFGTWTATASEQDRTMTPEKDGELGSGATWIGWKIYNSSPANVSVDTADHGINMMQSFYIELSNA